MMEELTLISAFLLGLMGAPHCAGMCGGIMTALTLSTRASSDFRLTLFYNLGRISSYVIAGAILAGIAQAAMHLVALHQAQSILKWLAIVFMLLMGLYLAGWWGILTRFEQVGQSLWRYLEPLGRRFIPVSSPLTAWWLGMIWGWLPCGLVYTALIYSMTAGSALQGGLLMLAFALGTLPIMLSIGLLGQRLQHWLQKPVVRRLAGLLVIGFAVHMAYTLVLSTASV